MLAGAVCGCGARLPPISGSPAPSVLPTAALPAGHHRIVFTWSLDDPDFIGRGEGAARLAHPDSVRLDFFLAGGLGAGAAVLIGPELRLSEGADHLARRLIPPAALLWGALGRMAVPPSSDTTVRVDADSLRADIGKPVAWRLTFARDTLRKVERVERGRIVEWVTRFPGGRVRYRNEVSRRQLDLTVTRSIPDRSLDAATWKLP